MLNRKPRLIHFDFSGNRGDECRIALHLASVDFDDVRILSKDWPTMEGSTPFDALPVLEIPGKSPLALSNAILLFLGRQRSLPPRDDFETVRHEALMFAVEDIRHTISPMLHISDPDQKRAARVALAANEFTTRGAQVERQLGAGPLVGGTTRHCCG